MWDGMAVEFLSFAGLKRPAIREMWRRMFLELSKAFSFMLSLMSLYPLMWNAFFVPGSRWEDRVWLFLGAIGFSGCVCFASGLLFCWPCAENPKGERSLLTTLPVRMYAWALIVMTALFVSSWYLDVYYVPLLWKNLP
jgi:hypothetical protein